MNLQQKGYSVNLAPVFLKCSTYSAHWSRIKSPCSKIILTRNHEGNCLIDMQRVSNKTQLQYLLFKLIPDLIEKCRLNYASLHIYRVRQMYNIVSVCTKMGFSFWVSIAFLLILGQTQMYKLSQFSVPLKANGDLKVGYNLQACFRPFL